MRLYEINQVKPDALVAITLESGKYICCPVDKLYKSYTESPSRNRLKRDGRITSVVFYNKAWVDDQLITIPLPLEEADWDNGMFITPENFTNILKYIIAGSFHFCGYPVVYSFDPKQPTESDKENLYKIIKEYCDMPIEEFKSLKNPFIDCCDFFLNLLYKKCGTGEKGQMFTRLLKAKELSI